LYFSLIKSKNLKAANMLLLDEDNFKLIVIHVIFIAVELFWVGEESTQTIF
jgi:hypothetical protein